MSAIVRVCRRTGLNRGRRALRRTLRSIGGRHLFVCGVASQPERPQPLSLFARRLQFGLVLGHSLLGLTRLLFLLNSASARRRASSIFMLNVGTPR